MWQHLAGMEFPVPGHAGGCLLSGSPWTCDPHYSSLLAPMGSELAATGWETIGWETMTACDSLLAHPVCLLSHLVLHPFQPSSMDCWGDFPPAPQTQICCVPPEKTRPVPPSCLWVKPNSEEVVMLYHRLGVSG